LRWAVAVSAILCVGFLAWSASPAKTQKPMLFSKILQVYSFTPEIAATAYNSRDGNATIIWLSGIDEWPSEFGQIWQVYSFTPEIAATTYNSRDGNATIIWLSGMDDAVKPGGKTSL
jgi:hypothetical protein